MGTSYIYGVQFQAYGWGAVMTSVAFPYRKTFHKTDCGWSWAIRWLLYRKICFRISANVVHTLVHLNVYNIHRYCNRIRSIQSCVYFRLRRKMEERCRMYCHQCGSTCTTGYYSCSFYYYIAYSVPPRDLDPSLICDPCSSPLILSWNSEDTLQPLQPLQPCLHFTLFEHAVKY